MIISVIGCGKSAEGWHNTPCDLSIGCNDVNRFGKDTDWLVVVNRKFTKEREAIIKDSKPKRFLTTIPYWQQQFPNAETLQLQRYSKHLKKGHVYSSKTSPFIALSLAFNAGAKDIILFGVDMHKDNPHPVINGKLLDYELRQYLSMIKNLNNAGVNVFTGTSTGSILNDYIPHYDKRKIL